MKSATDSFLYRKSLVSSKTYLPGFTSQKVPWDQLGEVNRAAPRTDRDHVLEMVALPGSQWYREIIWQPRTRQQGSQMPRHFLLGTQSSRNFLGHFPKIPERKDSTPFNRPAPSSGSLYWISLSHATPREETNAQAAGWLQKWGLLGILARSMGGPSSTSGQD